MTKCEPKSDEFNDISNYYISIKSYYLVNYPVIHY